MNIIGQNKLNKRFRFVANIVLVSLLLTASLKANAEMDMRDARSVGAQYVEDQGISLYPDMEDTNWAVRYWGQWTTEQRQSYLAGVQDTAEAIGFQMAGADGHENRSLLRRLPLVSPRNDLTASSPSGYISPTAIPTRPSGTSTNGVTFQSLRTMLRS